MRTIERNYRKNPHTANFLMTFHQAAYGLPSEIDENQAEIDLAAQDLLDSIPVDQPVDRRTPRQVELMDKLTADITELDAGLGARTAAWIKGHSEAGNWESPARGGDVSQWITKMIDKVSELRKAQAPAAPVATGAEVEIPANNYAITKDGEVKCYTVDYGKAGTRWEGFLFLNRISSDERYPIRNTAEKASILAAIREDVEASQILAGVTLRSCRRCHRTLSDTKNPYFSVALGPDCGAM